MNPNAVVYDAVIVPSSERIPEGTIVRIGAVTATPTTTTVIATPTTYTLKTTALVAVGALLTGGLVGWYARGARR
jgi:hypothetical protein